jgi:hypothetical protein
VKKSKALRLAGFAGALCASGALLATSISGTGAYFTDSHNGSINAGPGHVRVQVSDASLNFDNLLPGDYKTDRVNYTADGTGAEDIWLVFPTDGSANAFLQTPSTGATPLGRFGHFAVTSTGGANFSSYNLTASPSGYSSSDSCGIDANGEGGSNQQAATKADIVPFCAPRPAILLQSNMNASDAGSADLTFGFTPLLKGGQDGPRATIVPFKIVATQHGVRPDDPNN